MISDYVRSKVGPADGHFGVTANGGDKKVMLRAGVEYLHMTGQFLTKHRAHAWIGTPEQARKCRAKFDVAAGCKMVRA